MKILPKPADSESLRNHSEHGTHWAYRKAYCDCLAAEIRRYIEDEGIPGWEAVAERPEASSLAFKVVKLDRFIDYKGTQMRVLYVEAWYYDEGKRDIVERLFCELS